MKVCSDCQRCYDDGTVSCVDNAHNSLVDFPERSCEMLEGYRLERLISSSACGETYKAEQLESGRPCIASFIHTDPELTERFLTDARTAAGMFHPGTADVYECGWLKNGELLYVIAEDAGDNTLRTFLENGCVPDLLTSIRIVRQAAEALHTLHLAGLIHGAVRPKNIMLSLDAADGHQVKLRNTDYGGVLTHAIISNKYVIDDSIDSLRYFAPEQFSGATTSVSTDIYALGVVFYEMLSGHAPFNAVKAADLIEMHRNQAPPEVKIDDFDLRMLVTHALSESLQKRADVRQASANAFARQLRHIEQLATHVSTPPPVIAVSKPVTVHKAAAPAASVSPTAPEAPAVLAQAGKTRIKETNVQNMAAPSASPDHPSRLRLHRRRVHSDGRNENVKAVGLRIGSTPVTIVSETTKVEWTTPDDDIPSISAVIEVRERERIAKGSPANVVPAEQPKLRRAVPDTPVPLAVLRYAARETAERLRSLTVAMDPEPASSSRTTGFSARSDEMPAADNREEFLPDLRDPAEQPDAIFASRGVENRVFPVLASRGILAAAGLLAAIILSAMWIGNSSGSTDSVDAMDTSTAEITTPEEGKPRPPEIPVPPVETVESEPGVVPVPAEEIVKTDYQPREETPANAKSVRPKILAETVTRSKEPGSDKPRAITAQKPVQAPAIESTLIIYSENGKVKSRSEPTDRSGATRPRIVKNPKS